MMMSSARRGLIFMEGHRSTHLSSEAFPTMIVWPKLLYYSTNCKYKPGTLLISWNLLSSMSIIQ